ncbi:glycosyltransferase family 2 protein [Allosphingosinicella indica]|uniref:Glycosyl transferase family 2 n=1 Tax=Allosphingosinicella indica TaxID=941907 RepID=A0A1X7GHF5_9SPHN|nr:glycosyltransferase family 2 protein [Allosphingosinicella indica]SMF69799.1 Glycosyl transferase family 2 [Allosphingosinicella indica]
MRPEPRISVAMGAYNAQPYLAEAIESILSQTFGDFEFLIVNDGSTDGSGDVIDAYAARDPRVRALHQPNAGLVASLNRAIDEARAPLIARMDADDISLPDRFEKQLAFMAANPDYGVVGTATDDIDEQGRITRNLDYHPLDHESFLEALDGRPLICHPSVIMHRDVLVAVGGYRRAFVHCEDYDLWLRLSQHTRICSIKDRLFQYRRSWTQVSTAFNVQQQIGAAVAFFAHQERIAGRPDPTEGLDKLPPIDALDDLFGRPGVAQAVRARVAPNLLHSGEALRSDGFDLLLRHIADGGARDGLWRTTARLMKLREPKRAARLAIALATSSERPRLSA